MGQLLETSQRHGSFPWAVVWTCPLCDVQFYCCDRTCGPKTRQRSPFVLHDQLVRHHRRNHNFKKSRVSVDTDDSFGTVDDDHDINDAPRFPIPKDAFEIFRVHLPTKRFFDDLQHHSFDVAVQGLVARSCYLDASICDPAMLDMSVTDRTLFFRIARLVFQLGPKHQHLLGGVLTGFEMRHPSPAGTSTSQSSQGLQLPTTHKAFIAKLLNQTNTNSLTSIIPRPPTVGLSGKHAYVSIPALVAYELGLANATVDPPYNAKFERLVISEHGQTLFQQAKAQLMAESTTIDGTNTSYVPLVVMLMMWFDGWDPNGSSKGNRSPVWSGSLTLVFVDLQGRVVSVATYPFAAGPGKADHEVIFEQILLDVRSLQAPLEDFVTSRRWYYSRAACRMALVYGVIFCIWEDQPGRRNETNLLGGNSNNHAVFGTSCYVKHLRIPIPACLQCREATLIYLNLGNFQNALYTGCQHCTNWCFPEDPQLSLYHRKVSDKFPPDAVAGQEFNHGGGRIDTSILQRAWVEACNALVTATWSESKVHIYLKTLCVNDSTVKALICQCRDHVMWNAIGANPEKYDETTRAYYRRKFATDPRQLEVPEPPAAWRLAPLTVHVETVMHLLGGVQKALLHKYCRVQYLPLAAYNTDKFGGWVMENYKSLCKLAPWLYHCFEDVALQRPTPYATPTKPQSSWTGVENKGYLRSRGIATPQTMHAPEAKSAVEELFARAEGPPAAIVRVARTVDPRDMRRLWCSCSTMCKDLMQVNHNTASINRTEARVRAFLSEIEALDAALQPAREKPLYLAKYNFPSLLRAVTHLRPFGNIRDLHEGGIEGEAMVKVLRPLLPNGLKDKFAQHLLRKAFRDTTVDRLLLNLEVSEDTDTAQFVECVAPRTVDSAELTNADWSDASTDHTNSDTDSDNEEDTAPDPFRHMRHMLDDQDGGGVDSGLVSPDGVEPSPSLFRRYNALATVQSYFTLGVPISVVLTNQKGPQRMGVIVSTCNQWWLQPLRLGLVQFDDDLGFTYFKVDLYAHDSQVLVRTKHDCEHPTYHIQLLNYATLLPALWLEAPFPYALVTMEGDHLDANYDVV
jgi:hypothetical protein